MTKDEKEIKLAELNQKMAKMTEELSGCDWCCGGGDEEFAALQQEHERISKIEPSKREEV